MTRLINWLLVSGIALVLSSAYLLDGPLTLDDHSFERAQADSLQDSIAAEGRQARFAKAAQAICGSNAAWLDLGGGTVQCLTHRGYKTTTAQVQP